MSLRTIYTNLNKIAFFICLIFSIALITAGFICPPLASIHPSVLTAVGEIFAFSALGTVIAAIEKGVDAKLTHNNTEIALNTPDPDKPTV